MEKYYVMVSGEQQGPFTKEEIISKNLPTDSYLYNSDLGGWKKISEIPAFSFKVDNNVSFDEKISDSQNIQTSGNNNPNSENGSVKSNSQNFDRKEKDYKPIRITIIVLTVIDTFIESAFAGSVGKGFNPLPVVINYGLTVLLVRNIYKKNKFFKNKVLITALIYLGLWLSKGVISYLIINAIN